MNAWINFLHLTLTAWCNLEIFLRWKNVQMLEMWLSNERLLSKSTSRFLTDIEDNEELPMLESILGHCGLGGQLKHNWLGEAIEKLPPTVTLTTGVAVGKCWTHLWFIHFLNVVFAIYIFLYCELFSYSNFWRGTTSLTFSWYPWFILHLYKYVYNIRDVQILIKLYISKYLYILEAVDMAIIVLCVWESIQKYETFMHINGMYE